MHAILGSIFAYLNRSRIESPQQIYHWAFLRRNECHTTGVIGYGIMCIKEPLLFIEKSSQWRGAVFISFNEHLFDVFGSQY